MLVDAAQSPRPLLPAAVFEREVLGDDEIVSLALSQDVGPDPAPRIWAS